MICWKKRLGPSKSHKLFFPLLVQGSYHSFVMMEFDMMEHKRKKNFNLSVVHFKDKPNQTDSLVEYGFYAISFIFYFLKVLMAFFENCRLHHELSMVRMRMICWVSFILYIMWWSPELIFFTVWIKLEFVHLQVSRWSNGPVSDIYVGRVSCVKT